MLQKILLSIVVLFFTVSLFAQKTKAKVTKAKVPIEYKFQVGSISSTRAKAEYFKIQKKISVGKFSIASCIIYFSGAGFPEIKSVKLIGGNLDQIKTQLDLCVSGTGVTFVNIKVNGPDGIRTIDEKTFYLY
jgi:hypothetical protein